MPCVPLLSKCNYEGSLLDSQMWHCLDTLAYGHPARCLRWVGGLFSSATLLSSLPGDCFTRRAYDTVYILSALLYKVIGKTYFFLI